MSEKREINVKVLYNGRRITGRIPGDDYTPILAPLDVARESMGREKPESGHGRFQSIPDTWKRIVDIEMARSTFRCDFEIIDVATLEMSLQSTRLSRGSKPNPDSRIDYTSVAYDVYRFLAKEIFSHVVS